MEPDGLATAISFPTDPNSRETNEVYEGTPYLGAKFRGRRADMTKFVIGTISDLDAPLLPPYKGIRADVTWLIMTDAMVQKERDDPALPPGGYPGAGAIIRAVLSEQSICAIEMQKVKATRSV